MFIYIKLKFYCFSVYKLVFCVYYIILFTFVNKWCNKIIYNDKQRGIYRKAPEHNGILQ